MEAIIKEQQQGTEHPTGQQTADYLYYNSSFVPTKFGMNNVGAICWCNSMIQLMLSLPSVNQTLLECEEELKDNAFASEYIKVLRATLPNSPELPPVDTSRLAAASAAILGGFLTRVRTECKNLNISSSQECADEAFTLFIDMLGCPRVEKLFSNVYELIITCKTCQKRVSSVRDKSYRIQLFTNVHLEDQEKFCRFLKIHPSECDYYKCEKCGEIMSKFFRAEKLKMLREVVVIIFNKFQMKDNRWFPQELIFRARDNKPPLKYKLVSIIEHSGTRFGGHYWVQSFRDGSWCRLNDSSVTLGDPNPTSATFMIAYHLVEPGAGDVTISPA